MEFASYAPLKGLPSFLDLSISLALGEHRSSLEEMGFTFTSTATPGGSGRFSLQPQICVSEGKPFFFETDIGGLMLDS